MQLQRYLLIDENRGMYFGQNRIEERRVCHWYIGKDGIGIRKKEPRMCPFPEDFLGMDDTLIIMPGLPKICLDKNPVFEFTPYDTGTDEIKYLIGLISSQRETHVFYSSEHENGKQPEILTFSRKPPHKEFYIPGKTMPVIFNTP
jgi:hypothetical protein